MTWFPLLRRSRPVRIVALILGGLLLLAAIAFLIGYDFFMLRWGAVDEGVLYRSRLLDADQLTDKVDEHRIRTIINFCDDQDADLAVTREKGIHYIWLPSSQVPSAETVERFLAVMDDAANHPVLIHCEHGVGRTGVAAALYHIEYEGWSADRAIQEARRYALWGSFEEGSEKERFLRGYVPRAKRGD